MIFCLISWSWDYCLSHICPLFGCVEKGRRVFFSLFLRGKRYTGHRVLVILAYCHKKEERTEVSKKAEKGAKLSFLDPNFDYFTFVGFPIFVREKVPSTFWQKRGKESLESLALYGSGFSILISSLCFGFNLAPSSMVNKKGSLSFLSLQEKRVFYPWVERYQRKVQWRKEEGRARRLKLKGFPALYEAQAAHSILPHNICFLITSKSSASYCLCKWAVFGQCNWVGTGPFDQTGTHAGGEKLMSRSKWGGSNPEPRGKKVDISIYISGVPQRSATMTHSQFQEPVGLGLSICVRICAPVDMC